MKKLMMSMTSGGADKLAPEKDKWFEDQELKGNDEAMARDEESTY